MNRLALIENAWSETVLACVREMTSTYQDQRFYAGAFWLCYVDYTMFGVPCFTMNTEEHVADNGGNTMDGIRWSPPNWEFDVIELAIQRMQPHYEALSSDLKDLGESVWDETISEHYQMLARVCRRTTDEVLQSSLANHVVGDFVIGIFEEREGEPLFSELVRNSIRPDRLATMPCPIWSA